MAHVDDEFLALFDDLSERDDDPDGPLLREFLGLWEGAATPAGRDAVLREYTEAHPRLATRFQEHVAATNIFRDATAHHPSRLGPYRVIRLLASGGMGNVYEAEDELLSRNVAVKTIRIGRAADGRLLERFERERKALARLHHTHIVPIYGAGEDDGLLYFAMPLIKGISLAELVATMSRWPSDTKTGSSPPPPSWNDILGKATSDAIWRKSLRRMSAYCSETSTRPEASGTSRSLALPATSARPPLTPDYFRQVARVVAVAAEALHSAHGEGVFHLDVKPSNVLLERAHDPNPGPQQPEHIWVIDFGLADAETDGTRQDGADKVRQPRDRTTRVFGTRGYMTPEMLKRGVVNGADLPPLDRRSDVWGLGVTLYQLLTLHMPFATDDEVLDVNRGPTPPRALVAGLPQELEAVVLKALAKRPADRYQTTAAFAADLRRWLEGFPTVAGGAGPLQKAVMWARRRPAAAFAAGMTAAFLVVAFLGAGQALIVKDAEAARARAEVARARAEAQVIERDNIAKKQEILATQRELDLIALPRLRAVRAPIRNLGWSEVALKTVGKLAASGGPDTAGRLKGEAAASLEGLDARVIKSFDKAANMLAFDPKGNRMLMGMFGRDPEGHEVRRVVVGDLAGQEGSVSRNFQDFGVLGFRNSDPLVLELDRADRPFLRLRDAITGLEKPPLLRSPLDGPAMIIAHTLSQDGSRAAGVVWRAVKKTPVANAGAPEAEVVPRLVPEGDTATLVVWDVATGRVVRTFEEKQPQSHDVVLSPDGSHLATWDVTGGQHEVAVWSVNDGALIGRFRTTRNLITSVAFGRDPVWHDADGPPWRLAVGEHGGLITIWDIHAGAVKSLARGTSYDVKALDFSPDGTLLASAGRGDLKIWDPSSGECLLSIPSGNFLPSVAFSPDGRLLAVAKIPGFGDREGVDVYGLEQGRGLRTLRGLQQRIEKLVFSEDGRRVAALSNDWELGVFDTSSGRLIGVAEGPKGFFTDNAALALNSDGARLVCSGGTEARLYDVTQKRLERSWKLPPALTEAVAIRPGGQVFLVRQETKGGKLPPSAQADPRRHPRVCRVYDLPEEGDPKKIAEITDFDWYVEHIALSPNGSYFAIQGISTATGKAARIIHLYDGLTGKPVGTVPTTIPPDDTGTGMRFDPMGTRLHVKTARKPDRFDIYEVPSLRPVGMVTELSAVNVGASRWVSVRPQTPDTPDMLVLREQGRPTPLLSIVRDVRVAGTDGTKFSPDGNHIAWGNQDGTVTVCDLNDVQKRLAGVELGW